MRTKPAAIFTALILCSVIAAESGAYTLYSQGSAAAALSEQYVPALSEMNLQLHEALLTYTPNADKAAEEEAASKAEEAASTSESPASTSEASPSTAEAAPDNSETDKPAESTVQPTEQEAEQEAEEEKPVVSELYISRNELAQEYRTELRKSGRELAEKLMDYDVALKKLRILVNRYDSRCKTAEKLAKQVLTGDCDEKTAAAAQEEAKGIYYEIQALLFDVSVMKTGIEGITGETLKDDFDFNGVYLITDALLIDAAAIGDYSQLSTMIIPEGAAPEEYEAPDSSKDYTAAVQAYYTLGAALRDYLSAAEDLKDGEHEQKLGQKTAEELQALIEAKEDKFLAAAQAKADFSKSLLALDETSGGGLTFRYGESTQEISALRETLPEEERGVGFWTVLRSEGGAVLYPYWLPAGTCRVDEEDDAEYSFVLKYGEERIGSGITGSPCKIPELSYRDGENYAEVTFYRNGGVVGTYKISVFAPYGGFIG